MLMDSLAEHEVYIEKEGRVLDDDEKAVPDTLSVGMAALTHGSSSTLLDEFNEQFEVLRRRRGLTPVHNLLGLVNTSGLSAPTPAPAPTPSTPDIAATDADDDDYADMPGLQVPDSDNNNDTDAEEDEDLFAESPTLIVWTRVMWNLIWTMFPSGIWMTGTVPTLILMKMTRRYLCIIL